MDRDVKVQGTSILRHHLRRMYGSSLELWVKSQCHRFEVFTVSIQVRMTRMIQAFGIIHGILRAYPGGDHRSNNGINPVFSILLQI
jgi:hypothetical protein